MARRGAGRLHGYLVIDKPAGITSHDVVGRIRRLTGERKVGHAGTLDPAATGVLPVAVGLATRTLEFLADSSKTYLAEITFGVSTDSYDGDGSVTGVSSVPELSRSELETTLDSMLGEQNQIPPMFSAINIGGTRLYDLARRGESIAREARRIVINEIELIDWSPPVATVCIDCSKGTYIRSIAHDLGERAGCGAHLSNLVRLRSGPFSIEESWTFSELSSMDLAADWESITIHPDIALEPMDGVIVDTNGAAHWRVGKALQAGSDSQSWARVYDEQGSWLGIAQYSHGENVWQPYKVVSEAA
jgi:tRNA pseudouridine55 synthase